MTDKIIPINLYVTNKSPKKAEQAKQDKPQIKPQSQDMFTKENAETNMLDSMISKAWAETFKPRECTTPLEDDFFSIFFNDNSNKPDYEKAKQLIKNPDFRINVKGHNLLTPLHIASDIGNEEMVKILLNKGAEVNSKQSVQYTPLHLAAANGHSKVVEMLLKKGANVNAKHCFDDTPLHLAAKHERADIVVKLIKSGAKINAVNGHGETPLALAVEYGNIKAAKILLNAGADINIPISNGSTPLHLASQNGDKEIVKLLLDKDANLNIQNLFGDTPLHDAISGCYSEEYLNNRENLNIFDSTLPFPMHGNVDIVRMLLKKGAEINIQNKDGNTPLHKAAYGNNIKIYNLLINSGADTNIKNNENYTTSEFFEIFNDPIKSEKYFDEHNPLKDFLLE